MAHFVIEGGGSLQGSIVPQGAKNECLQVLCAGLLTEEEVIFENVPDILDVRHLLDLLTRLGVKIGRSSSHSYTFQATHLDDSVFEESDFLSLATRLRGSVMLLGPLLGRMGHVVISRPQGDKIGRRRLDTHIRGLEALGARFTYDRKAECYALSASRLRGTRVLLEEASLTATANLIMAALCAEGDTEIYPAACEPYIQQLCRMCCRMGAKIEGIGTNCLHIQGAKHLKGTRHRMQPDIIEIGSFIGMAALTNSSLCIKGAGEADIHPIERMFRSLGLSLERKGKDIWVDGDADYTIGTFIDGSLLSISDGIWPSLSPDMISIGIVTALQAQGTVLFHQRMFESRLFFVDKLIEMGGRLILCDPHRVAVTGLGKKKFLYGIRMSSPDIRAGVALLITALSARGKSVIENVGQIDRGYESIEKRLQAIGAQITRINSQEKEKRSRQLSTI